MQTLRNLGGVIFILAVIYFGYIHNPFTGVFEQKRKVMQITIYDDGTRDVWRAKGEPEDAY